MNNLWYFVYNFITLPIIKFFFFVGQFFNKKIKLGIEGRKKLFENLIIDLAGIDRNKTMIWFHSASMGEFEQAKPIIEHLKANYDLNIIITFFSPSGYNNSLKYQYADVIAYFPFDSHVLAKRFLNLVRPNMAVFMRYDIWPNMIWQLSMKKIPSFIVDATMKQNSPRKWPLVRSFHKSLYSNITGILTVSDNDKNSFLDFGLTQSKIETVGDTRYDRVHQKSLHAREKKLFKDGLFENKKIFVAGSSWESDEDVIIPSLLKLMEIEKDLIVIVVPHEPTLIHIERLELMLGNEFQSIRFSYMNQYNNERIIIIDSIGILLTLYTYADAAYVGGSFKQGIHNVLEPAVYGIPVIFGPKNENSQEAVALKKMGGAFEIENKKDAYRIFRKIYNENNYRKKAGEICAEFVSQNIGATEKIIKVLKNYF